MMDQYQPRLISQPNLARLLGLTPSGLKWLRVRDNKFPKPIKGGAHRQATCYYLLAEVDEWINSRAALR